MIERITKKIYLFCMNHIRFMTWFTYIVPIVGIVSCNEFVFRITMFIDIIYAIIMQIGNMMKWNEEVK